MGLGKLDTPITIVETRTIKDREGFAKQDTVPVACVRAYKEDKNATERWANNAMYQQASALFRFRYIPRVEITTDMKIECYSGVYDIVSVENVKGKNMYYEVLGKKEVTPGGKGNDEVSGRPDW